MTRYPASPLLAPSPFLPRGLRVVIGFGLDPTFPTHSVTGRLPDPCSPSSPGALARVAFGEA
jgi:hypothetical protein